MAWSLSSSVLLSFDSLTSMANATAAVFAVGFEALACHCGQPGASSLMSACRDGTSQLTSGADFASATSAKHSARRNKNASPFQTARTIVVARQPEAKGCQYTPRPLSSRYIPPTLAFARPDVDNAVASHQRRTSSRADRRHACQPRTAADRSSSAQVTDESGERRSHTAPPDHRSSSRTWLAHRASAPRSLCLASPTPYTSHHARARGPRDPPYEVV